MAHRHTRGKLVHRSALRLIAAFLLALAVIPLGATSASAATYTITGRITGLDANGVAVAMPGAELFAFAPGSDRFTGPVAGYSVADDNGNYTLSVDSAGPHDIEISCNCPDSEGAYTLSHADEVKKGVSVTAGTALTLDWRLARYGTIKGRVVDEAGVPVTTAVPWAEYLGDLYDPSGHSGVAVVDANGYYTIQGVTPGLNQMGITDTSAGGDTWTYQQTEPTVDAGPAVTTVNWVAKRRTDVFTTAPAPTVTGTASVGQVLTAQPGTWAPAPDSFSYQWSRVSSTGVVTPISGATAATYTLTSTDHSHGIRVAVTANKAGYVSKTTTSATTATVLTAFTSAPTPTITGTRAVGYTLTAVPGTWSPAPTALAYQWFRSGVAISGATAATYKLTTADQGAAITVRVTATKAGYTTTARTSAATGAILGVFTTAPTPTITGTKKVGYTLTANPGTWSPTPSSFAYQWYRVSSTGTVSAITGATAKTYKLTTTDKGKTIYVRVTAQRTGYLSKALNSARTVAIG